MDISSSEKESRKNQSGLKRAPGGAGSPCEAATDVPVAAFAPAPGPRLPGRGGERVPQHERDSHINSVLTPDPH